MLQIWRITLSMYGVLGFLQKELMYISLPLNLRDGVYSSDGDVTVVQKFGVEEDASVLQEFVHTLE